MRTTTSFIHKTPALPMRLEPSGSVLQAWNRFWFSAADPSTLGLMRIFTGLIVLYVHLIYTPVLQDYFGKDGWVSLRMADEYRLESPQTAPRFDWKYLGADLKAPSKDDQQYIERWNSDPRLNIDKGQYKTSIWFHVTSPTWMMIIHVGFLGAMFLFTIGLWTRVTSVIVWLAALCYIQRSFSTLFGMDTIMNVLLLYLMIGPSGAAYSVDSWLKKVRKEQSNPETSPGVGSLPPQPLVSANFTLRLMQVHYCIIYLASGTSKLQGASWWDGTALWGVMANYEFNPMHLQVYREVLVFLTEHRSLWEIVMTGGVVFTLFTELGLPFLIWNRRMRPYMMMASTSLHIGIGLIMGLSTFSLLMICLLMAFIPGETTRWAVQGGINWLRGITPAVEPQRTAADKELTLQRK